MTFFLTYLEMLCVIRIMKKHRGITNYDKLSYCAKKWYKKSQGKETSAVKHFNLVLFLVMVRRYLLN